MELKNGIEKVYSRFFGKEKNHESVIVGVEETPTTPPHPLFTFFNIGPGFLTYSYPVDAKLYREIYDESGLIGPSEKQHKDELPDFIPQGKRGEAIVVSVERWRVKQYNG